MKQTKGNIPTPENVEYSIVQRISMYSMMSTDEIDTSAPIGNLDLDSILAMTIIEELQQEYDVDLPTFLFFKYETIKACADAVVSYINIQRNEL